jgi:hypothetical protein
MLTFRDLANQYLSSASRNMSGGAKMMSSNSTWFGLFLLTLAIFFIKAYLIFFCYNMVMPRVLMSLNTEGWQRFRQISYWDSILLMILVNNLTN